MCYREFAKTVMSWIHYWIREMTEISFVNCFTRVGSVLGIGLGLGLATNNARPNFCFSHFTNLLVISRNPWFQAEGYADVWLAGDVRGENMQLFADAH